MEKRGKQRLGVCAALVLLILGGFMDNNVKTELKRSVGAQFCYFLAVEKKVEWPMEVLAVYPVKNRNVTAKIEYDPEQLQKENEVATTSACGSALDTSSAAQIMMRRAINRISSPA